MVCLWVSWSLKFSNETGYVVGTLVGSLWSEKVGSLQPYSNSLPSVHSSVIWPVLQLEACHSGRPCMVWSSALLSSKFLIILEWDIIDPFYIGFLKSCSLSCANFWEVLSYSEYFNYEMRIVSKPLQEWKLKVVQRDYTFGFYTVEISFIRALLPRGQVKYYKLRPLSISLWKGSPPSLPTFPTGAQSLGSDSGLCACYVNALLLACVNALPHLFLDCLPDCLRSPWTSKRSVQFLYRWRTIFFLSSCC